MLWRVRTTLPDRPGSLATLSQHCGEQGVNILGLQIFPGIGGVTDELVLRAPDDWSLSDVAALIETAGGTSVTVGSCTEHALVDGPTRYLQAVLQLVRAPDELPQILAGLLDAETAEQARLDELEPVQDRIDVLAGPHRFAVSRTPEFTASEHARASAFAEVAEELLAVYEGRRVLPGAGPVPTASPTGPARRTDGRRSDDVHRPDDHAPALLGRHHLPPLRDPAAADGRPPRPAAAHRRAGRGRRRVDRDLVGVATVSEARDGAAEVTLLVEDGWQRRGVGTRLLSRGRAAGARTRSHRDRDAQPVARAALPALAFASGLRARIRLSGDTVLVTVGVDGLKPLDRGAAADDRGRRTRRRPRPERRAAAGCRRAPRR